MSMGINRKARHILVLMLLSAGLLTCSQAANEKEKNAVVQSGLHFGAADFGVHGNSLFFLPDGRTVVVGGGNGPTETELRDVSTGRRILSVGKDGFGVAVSRDGTRIATAGTKITVFDRATSKELLSLPGNNYGVMPVALSADGTRLAFADNDVPGLSILDIGTGATVSLKGQHERYGALAFSPDGKRLAAGCHEYGMDPCPIKIYDSRTGEQLSDLKAHHRAILGLVFSSNGKVLASVGNDGLALCNLADGHLRFIPAEAAPQTPSAANRSWSLAMSPDDKSIAVGTDESIQLIDAARGEIVREIYPTGHMVWGVAFSPSGPILGSISGSGPRALEFWKTTDGSRMGGADRHLGSVTRVEFFARNHLATFGDDLRLKIWNMATAGLIWEAQASHFALSPGGQAAYATPARLIDLQGKRDDVKLADVDKDAGIASWCDTERLVVGDSLHQKIVAYDGRGKVLAKLNLVDPLTGLDFLRALACFTDSQEIFFAGGGYRSYGGGTRDSGFMGIWRPPDSSWKALVRLPLPVEEFVGTPSGKILALCHSYNDYAVFDARTGKSITRVPNARFAFESAALSPDGKYFAFGGEKRTVLLWNIEAQRLQKLTGQAVDGRPEFLPAPENPAVDRLLIHRSDLVSAVAFTRDGSKLASANPDGGVDLWMVPSGKSLGYRPGEKARVLVFSRDGSQLAAGLYDGSIRAWDLQTTH